MKLTPRETQIWKLLARGANPKAIGSELGISSKTVEYHTAKLYRDTGVLGLREVSPLVALVHLALRRRVVKNIYPAWICLVLFVSGCVPLDLRQQAPPPAPSRIPLQRTVRTSMNKTAAPSLAAPSATQTVLPVLNLALSGANVLLTWPTNGARNYVQSTPDLTAPAWTTRFAPAAISGGLASVSLPRTNASAFYKLLSLTGPASVTLAWNASADPNVAGYQIYSGIASRNYTNLVNVSNATSCSVSNLATGRNNYFAATAYNALGMESDFSNEAIYFAP